MKGLENPDQARARGKLRQRRQGMIMDSFGIALKRNWASQQGGRGINSSTDLALYRRIDRHAFSRNSENFFAFGGERGGDHDL